MGSLIINLICLFLFYQKPLSYVIEESSFGVGAQGVHVVYSGVGHNAHVYSIIGGCQLATRSQGFSSQA